MPRAVIALGANLGNRAETLQAAVTELSQLSGTQLLAQSSLYESVALKPAGLDASAPAYLNAVALLDTSLTPLELLAELLAIEAKHGRVRAERWGDRTLDLDLISYGDVQSEDAALTLPHPRAQERSFVVVPWLECDAQATLPGIGVLDSLPAALDAGLRKVEAFEVAS